MLRTNVAMLQRTIAASDAIRTVGKLRSARGLLTATIPAAMGEVCRVEISPQRHVAAEVVGVDVPPGGEVQRQQPCVWGRDAVPLIGCSRCTSSARAEETVDSFPK